MGKPKIRFKGFTEEWERRKLSELVLLITKGTTPLDKSGNGEINFIKIENIDPSSGEITPEMKISRKEHNGYLKRSQLQENDILFSIAGTLGRVSIVKSCVLPANTNQALAIIRTKEGDLRYLTTVLKGNAVADFIRKNPTVGAQPNLSLEQVGNIELPYPSMAEQEKIGEYFFSLDNLITLHQRKCDETKKLKKYMLQKMFPQNGMKVPEIRFEGFTGDWEQRKFSELVTIERGGSPRPIDKFITKDVNGLNWVKIGDAPEQGYYITHTAEKIIPEGLSKTREVHQGDLILSNSMSFGKPYIMAIDGCIHDGWILIRDTQKNFDLKFLCILLGTENMLNQYKAMAAGSTVNNLNKELVGGTNISYPSLAEQSILGEYFGQIDHLITLHQRKRDELVKIKKYMLQNMFV